MEPNWLHALAIAALVIAFVCAGLILLDVVRRPQHIAIMNCVWPITALYAGPLAIWMYLRFGRGMTRAAVAHNGGRMPAKPFWATVVVGDSHCGAGCTLGDILAEFAIFFSGWSIAGSVLRAEYFGDYILAYAFGILFQYFAIVPMRGLGLWEGLKAAIKSDTLAVTAFEVGLFGWMALSYFVLFHPHLNPLQPTYWLMMQVGMLLGFCTSYPVNAWLIRSGIKEAM